MTKEELYKEANLEASIMPWDEETDTWEDIAERAYIKGAEPREKRITELEAQIEKMKSDVMSNIKWADENCDTMWQKLVKMWNQWEMK